MLLREIKEGLKKNVETCDISAGVNTSGPIKFIVGNELERVVTKEKKRPIHLPLKIAENLKNSSPMDKNRGQEEVASYGLDKQCQAE